MRGVLFRSAALLLALMIASHLLPFTLARATGPSPVAEKAPIVFFEPLQVCDGGSDFSGFLADHPWVFSYDFQGLFIADRTCCPPPATQDLAEGSPPAVYHPPRLTLS